MVNLTPGIESFLGAEKVNFFKYKSDERVIFQNVHQLRANDFFIVILILALMNFWCPYKSPNFPTFTISLIQL